MASKQPAQWMRDGRIQRKWTPEEDARLRDLRAREITFVDIARQIGRTENSCISRAQKLGLSTKRQPPSKPRSIK